MQENNGFFKFWGMNFGALPVAVAVWLALEGDWRRALFLTAWGVLVIHPVDNLLGPVLVSSALRMHTLLMFFSVIGGLAAFGAAGVVIGPVTVAIVAALMEMADRRRETRAATPTR